MRISGCEDPGILVFFTKSESSSAFVSSASPASASAAVGGCGTLAEVFLVAVMAGVGVWVWVAPMILQILQVIPSPYTPHSCSRACMRACVSFSVSPSLIELCPPLRRYQGGGVSRILIFDVRSFAPQSKPLLRSSSASPPASASTSAQRRLDPMSPSNHPPADISVLGSGSVQPLLIPIRLISTPPRVDEYGYVPPSMLSPAAAFRFRLRGTWGRGTLQLSGLGIK